jgi:hypothetical protein
MAAHTDKRQFEKIVANVKKKFDQSKYYEGQQMLKTLHTRLTSQNKFEQASKLLSDGALILMEHKKYKESVELTGDLLQSWRLSNVDRSFNEERAKLLHELFCLLPETEEQCVNDFMRYVLEWITELKKQSDGNKETVREIEKNMVPLYRSYGINLFKTQHYYKASNALALADCLNPMIRLFAEWSQKSPTKERPLFITRIVLQYLSAGNIQMCRKFIDNVCPRDDTRGSSYRHPLENFSDLLCESMERKSVVLFNVVTKTYEPLLKIDPKLLHLLHRAAFTCLGIPMPKNQSGLFGNILSLLS